MQNLKAYGFDGACIGLLSQTKSSVYKALVPRPAGLTLTDWYTFAGRITDLLNKERNSKLLRAAARPGARLSAVAAAKSKP